LRRSEEHPHSLRGCRDSEIQALSPPRVPLVFQGPGAPVCHSKGAPVISRCTCNFHGRIGRYRGAPAVSSAPGSTHQVHLSVADIDSLMNGGGAGVCWCAFWRSRPGHPGSSAWCSSAGGGAGPGASLINKWTIKALHIGVMAVLRNTKHGNGTQPPTNQLAPYQPVSYLNAKCVS
jgi:hypothetical protein